jgi:hypothetical protein
MTPALLLLLLTAGCSDPKQATDEALAKGERKADDDGRVECAVEGAGSFERACTIERVRTPEGTTLVLRHPGGGFRRLLVTTDGRGVVAADGAEPATVSVLSDDRIEVVLGEDRYRLPATVKGAGP